MNKLPFLHKTMSFKTIHYVLVNSILIAIIDNVICDNYRNRNSAYHKDSLILFPDEDSFQHRPEFHEGQPPLYLQHSSEFHGSAKSYHPPNSPFHQNSHDQIRDKPVEEVFNNNSNSIPLDLIRDINEYQYNVSDLLLHFVEGDSTEMGFNNSPILQDRFGEGERNAATTPKFAGCIPALTTVNLADKEDGRVLYLPQCTRIEQCGGCCSHKLLSCQPTETELVSFQVMKTQFTGGKKLKFIGKEVKIIEKHLKCKCDCKVRAEDCKRFQQYKKAECRCACANLDEEKKCSKQNQTKLWDPNLCSCMCREITPCSTGYEFNPVDCSCTETPPRRYNKYERRGYEEGLLDVIPLN